MADSPKMALWRHVIARIKWWRWFFSGPWVLDPNYKVLAERWEAREPTEGQPPHVKRHRETNNG